MLILLGQRIASHYCTETHSFGKCVYLFEAQDIRQSLTFPNASFDLIHLTCLVERIPTEQWFTVLRGCFRVLRKDGFLLWTETE